MRTLLIAFLLQLSALSASGASFVLGESVLSNNGVYGKVVGAYKNGMLSVKYTTQNLLMQQDPKRIAHLYGQSGGFRVGNIVISRNGVYGKVVGVYETTGELAVKYISKNDPMRQRPSQLAHTGR